MISAEQDLTFREYRLKKKKMPDYDLEFVSTLEKTHLATAE